MSIILFSLLIGGLVAIINKNGGMAGIVAALLPIATTRERGQVATSLLGTAIFFDDYANTMVVGNTMRPITDRLKISREKLAYLVDSTAAPIASIGLITTWIGFQVGLLDDAAKGLILESENRVISGSVLSGRTAMGDAHGYLGRYHLQISALKEGRERVFLSWVMPGFDRFSIIPVFLGKLLGKKAGTQAPRNSEAE